MLQQKESSLAAFANFVAKSQVLVSQLSSALPIIFY
jgi:hypothetical protein